MTDTPEDAAAQLQTDLGELSGLARAGLAAQDDHLVALDQPCDLFPALADRKLGRILDSGDQRPAALEQRPGLIDRLPKLRESLVVRLPLAPAMLQPAQSAAQDLTVIQGAKVQIGSGRKTRGIQRSLRKSFKLRYAHGLRAPRSCEPLRAQGVIRPRGEN